VEKTRQIQFGEIIQQLNPAATEELAFHFERWGYRAFDLDY
jgi:hypothetical protein